MNELLSRIARRQNAIEDSAARTASEPNVGAPSLLAATTRISVYPTSAQSFFACRPLTLMGAENEGATASVASRDGIFLALNLGSSVPPQGTQVLVTFVGSRWVFRYDT